MLSAYLSDLFPYPKYARKLKLVEIGGANCDMMHCMAAESINQFISSVQYIKARE
jgi:hypothetical protein